ncbi:MULTISPECIES: FAD-binding oxidoreductase [unclassified Achromobacter]|uniref:NAD(P)/FAD-dependent oxidoreductase n=1 Tax=unclassified Achromobacter TaxID=2626865 RepID=UPI000B51BB07|nr:MULTISPECIES: FAD-dependent oxidoreductase [unclassified Achromobacter]OWT80343.1 nopaline dehydrogenase [Achromobacter sp. HZ34]OWT82226.1 nopaline dehydrogenase [Achromobacter sp. HZ28]
MSQDYDYIVAGAGMVGSAIALGLAGRGRRVLMLDGADTDFRAAKANFGLVWVQGKGYGNVSYQRLSHEAATLFPAFADGLQRETGIDLHYERRGGLHFCLGEAEWEDRQKRMRAWEANTPERTPCVEMLDRSALEGLLPALRLGADVSGGSFCPGDGHLNPLRLLAALQAAYQNRGGRLISRHRVDAIAQQPGGGFVVSAGQDRYTAGKVIITAGLGSNALNPMVGLDITLRPQRGQVLVTERAAPLLPFPASGVRQTGDGTVMVGLTQEDVGYDINTTAIAATRMSRKIVRVLPDLAQLRLVRQWSCLRVMTQDGCPVYAESATQPGAWTALCHSGVTLASFHAGPLAQAIDGGGLPLSFADHLPRSAAAASVAIAAAASAAADPAASLSPISTDFTADHAAWSSFLDAFNHERFDVSQAA